MSVNEANLNDLTAPLVSGQETAISLYFTVERESGQIKSGPHFKYEWADNVKGLDGVVVRVLAPVTVI